MGKAETELYPYRLTKDGKPLEYTKEELDLRVIIDDKLSFEQHIAEDVKKKKKDTGGGNTGVFRTRVIYDVIHCTGTTPSGIRKSNLGA